MKEEEPRLELKATMLNINKGHNKKLMDACQTLKDYAEYTALVRGLADHAPCGSSREGGRRLHQPRGAGRFFKKNRAEAIKVSIYEYDEERHIRQTKEEGYEEGYESGLVEGEKNGRQMFRQTILLYRAGKTYEEIAQQCGISLEEVRDMLDGIA